ncbi:GNAT family N-acetyltransferase [Streptomyces sp. MAR4 CNX-425]|uniref:GNAT family N-acetyltransferase n=1 Tax=Streptomyces sp. MAR4 CNX-425 TaxID=3406343 RepID=UPI003B50F146
MRAEVYRDRWGIPHIRAADPRELAHAQGHNAAVDRAWQLETERHRAAGTAAAFLGASALDWDVLVRRVRLDDTARRCFRWLAEEDTGTAGWLSSYADGVNAGLAEGAAAAPEFAAAGLAPGRWSPWTPLAVWLSTHLLFAGLPAKLWRQVVAERLGAAAVPLFAADGPVTAGSNGWLVTGERTAGGGALIAGDPHRFIEDPGVYQQVHLACPEYDVVGFAVPGVPGLPHFGHTGGVAWAITHAMADYQDVYRERLRRRAGRVEALGPDGWRPAAAHSETVEVAGAAPVRVEVVETGRGPVFAGGPEGGGDGEWEALSLRYPPRVYGDLGFSALPALLAARRVADVDAALDRWAEPVNVVLAADTEGGLLHRVAGAVPVRDEANLHGAVPAWESAYEWRGRYAPMPAVPVTGGTAVMANERGPAAPFGAEFAPPYRAERIRALLAGGERWRAGDMAAVHTDTYTAAAGPLLDLLAGAGGLGPAAGELRDRLLRWDRRMDAGSADALAYARLRSAVVRALAAHPALAPLASPPPYPGPLLPWLDLRTRIAYALNTLLTTDRLPEIDRPALVRAAAEEAAGHLAAAGPDEPATWGEAHRLAPWQALPDGDAEWPGLAGDHDCVLATAAVPGVTDRCLRAPAARYVWDVARREESRWVVPFGASGVPGSPHHRDQLEPWLRGGLVPVLTDWQALKEGSMTTARPAPRDRTPRYACEAAGLGAVRVVPVDPDADAALLHGWVTAERARFWGMTGLSRRDVRDVYAHMDTLTTHHAHLMLLDGEPVALLQTYDPAADRVSACYPVEPGDLGIHLLVGPAAGAARPGFTAALIQAVTGFAAAGGARRLVVEPDAGNGPALARMRRAGFVTGPEITLPEVDLPEVHLPAKRARLAFLPLSGG